MTTDQSQTPCGVGVDLASELRVCQASALPRIERLEQRVTDLHAAKGTQHDAILSAQHVQRMTLTRLDEIAGGLREMRASLDETTERHAATARDTDSRISTVEARVDVLTTEEHSTRGVLVELIRWTILPALSALAGWLVSRGGL